MKKVNKLAVCECKFRSGWILDNKPGNFPIAFISGAFMAIVAFFLLIIRIRNERIGL